MLYLKDLGMNAKSWLTWNMLWIAIFSVVFALFFCEMPKYHDDYWYMYHLRPWFAGQEIAVPEEGGNIFKYGIPWQMIFDTWQEHWCIDNIRLGNLIVAFLLLFPKWFGSGLMTIMLIWSVMLGFKIAGIDWRKSPLVPFALALWTLCLPFSNNFGALTYQINYIPPTLLALLLLERIMREQRVRDRSTARTAIGNITLCVLIGAWHEGFGVPIGFAIIIMMTFFKSWRRKDLVIGVILIFIMSLILLTVPGMQIKRGFAANGFILNGIAAENVDYVLRTFDYLYVVAFAGFCITLAFKRLRKLAIINQSTIFLLISGAIAIMVTIYSHAAVRMAYMPQFFAVIVILQLLKKVSRRKGRRGYCFISVVLIMPFYLFSMVHMVYVDAYAFKYKKMMTDAVAACSRGEEYIFESLPLNINRPVMLGNRPVNKSSFSEYLFPKIQVYFDRIISEEEKDGFIAYSAIFPYGFDQIDNTQGVDISHGQGLRFWNDYFYIPYDSLKKIGLEQVFAGKRYRDFMRLEVNYGKGYRSVKSEYYRFRSKKDGKEYVWIVPPIPWHLPYIRTLQQARLRPLDAE